MKEADKELTLDQTLRRITLSGCLCIVYMVGTWAPLATDFFRALGAGEVFFGLLGGIPSFMISMQFVSAVAANHVRRRKPLFMFLTISERSLYLIISLLPVLFFRANKSVLLVWMLGMIALSNGLGTASTPLWTSWMADIVPRRILNRFWGKRQLWINFTYTAAFLAVAAYSYLVRLPPIQAFPILIAMAVAVGITDILLVTKIKEPSNILSRDEPVLKTLLAPLLDKGYRSIIVFQCVFLASTMFASVFMQLHILKIIGLSVWRTTVIWAFAPVGSALFSAQWGRLADKFGHRPILVICSMLKAVLPIFFVVATPSSAMWLLSTALLVDGIWTAGITVAVNGYVLKMAPRKNRSMFIASVMGTAGIFGGLGAMAGGKFLKETAGLCLTLFGRGWTNFHLLFFLSIFIRASCLAAALNVREIHALAPAKLLNMILGPVPERLLAFPVGLYRRLKPESCEGQS